MSVGEHPDTFLIGQSPLMLTGIARKVEGGPHGTACDNIFFRSDLLRDSGLVGRYAVAQAWPVGNFDELR